jgi:hypothetical protein
MSANTSRLGLVKPGGGSTGVITPADIVDIDVLNANADKIDAAVGGSIVTSTTRPSSPYNGQLIYETDTQQAAIYSGSAWLYLAAAQMRLVKQLPFPTATTDFGTTPSEAKEFSFTTIVGHRYVCHMQAQGGQISNNGTPQIAQAWATATNPNPTTTQTGTTMARAISGVGMVASAVAMVGTSIDSFVATGTTTYWKVQGSSTATAARFNIGLQIYDAGSVIG